MRMGMIGLGRMGANMVRRLMKAGHECVVFDVHAEAVDELTAEGATGTKTIEEFVAALSGPRVCWMMIPAAFVDGMVDQISPLLQKGDILIDGGNSYYRDDIDRAERLTDRGIHYVDVGVSGGVWGLDRGYCMMIGGHDEAVTHIDSILSTLAPSMDEAPRTPGRRRPVGGRLAAGWRTAAIMKPFRGKKRKKETLR